MRNLVGSAIELTVTEALVATDHSRGIRRALGALLDKIVQASGWNLGPVSIELN